MTQAPLIQTVDLAKRYKKRMGFEHVHFELHAGEAVFLVGPNGAGKSSLIRCLLGLTHPDQGEIKVMGFPPSDPRARRTLGYLPERFSPPSFLTGAEYLHAMQKLSGHKQATQPTFEVVLAQLRFPPDALRARISSYSKGMSQKLGLASFLVSQPAIWVLDEPMTGLDPESRYLLRGCLKSHLDSGGSAFISTHALEDIHAVGGRVLMLYQGQQVFFGTAPEAQSLTGTGQLEDAYLKLCSKKGRGEACI